MFEMHAPRRERDDGRPIPAADDVAGALRENRPAVPVGADGEFSARFAQGVRFCPAKRIVLIEWRRLTARA